MRKEMKWGCTSDGVFASPRRNLLHPPPPFFQLLRPRDPRCKTHLRLRDLIVMVGEAEVDAASVNINLVLKGRVAHGRALNVPAGAPLRTREGKGEG